MRWYWHVRMGVTSCNIQARPVSGARRAVFFRNASTRPAVSTILCRTRLKTDMAVGFYRHTHVGNRQAGMHRAPQVREISVSMDAGWCEIFIGPPLTDAFAACYVCEAAADTSVRSFSAKTCLGTTTKSDPRPDPL